MLRVLLVDDNQHMRAIVTTVLTGVGVKHIRETRDGGEALEALRDWPADFDGSAKVALIGLDRSHAAWLQIVESGFATYEEVARFIADVVGIGEAIEQAFPDARAFVRPGFDDLEMVGERVGVVIPRVPGGFGLAALPILKPLGVEPQALLGLLDVERQGLRSVRVGQ